VIRSASRTVDLRIQDRTAARGESWLRITVVQALSRGERFDTTLQKCTELGVAAFQPLLTERTEVRMRAEKLPRRLAHWQSVVVSACEQSGRAIVPEVTQPLTLTEWLARPASGMRLVLDPGSADSLASVEPGNRVEIVIGPEGGFSDAEISQMQGAGVRGVALGPRVLRTETAGPAAVTVLQATSGDLA
jgi:16S rRNA (uracil1498-N3)-methyltransferase